MPVRHCSEKKCTKTIVAMTIWFKNFVTCFEIGGITIYGHKLLNLILLILFALIKLSSPTSCGRFGRHVCTCGRFEGRPAFLQNLGGWWRNWGSWFNVRGSLRYHVRAENLYRKRRHTKNTIFGLSVCCESLLTNSCRSGLVRNGRGAGASGTWSTGGEEGRDGCSSTNVAVWRASATS